MKIRIIAIGKPSKEYRALLEEYEKRIDVEVLEYKESVKEVPLKGYVIVLDRQGEQLTSEEFAKIDHEFITFTIGGPEGLPENIKKKANKTISFGRITLPHQLARLVLTEQIYRAATIKKGQKYHK